jgi:hypothetical protein
VGEKLIPAKSLNNCISDVTHYVPWLLIINSFSFLNIFLLHLIISKMAAYQDAADNPHEATSLLPQQKVKDHHHDKSVLHRALFCGFIVSLSFGVTQVPLVLRFITSKRLLEIYAANNSQSHLCLPPHDMCCVL